ncbi:60S ribosomal protein L7, partial [Rhizoclosmatium hyalinum]
MAGIAFFIIYRVTRSKNTVPESILKKRKAVEKLNADRAVKAAETKKANKAKRQVIFKRAEQYVKEYRAKE